ncbi:hypothetical protein WNY63_17820 [Pseudoalteromonas neustonica]|uniref:Uncharacterized protein n=1 Tax=Pseudoalteromonas neustonica TaxID=1840331 RepID=A0ABU9U7S1_9GAMM
MSYWQVHFARRLPIDEHLTTMNNMLAAMWEAIPPHEVEARMRAAHQLADVVHITKSKKAD